jgi:hypothetical protein
MNENADEALGHLQAAARELVAAARAFLDLVEEVVEDPKAGEALINGLGDLARKARPTAPGNGTDDGGVEHIPVD